MNDKQKVYTLVVSNLAAVSTIGFGYIIEAFKEVWAAEGVRVSEAQLLALRLGDSIHANPIQWAVLVGVLSWCFCQLIFKARSKA
jgi:hypothetical protein